jgi:hypothetical protein
MRRLPHPNARGGVPVAEIAAPQTMVSNAQPAILFPREAGAATGGSQ